MARGDETAARERITDGIEWHAVGRRPVVGADEFCRAFSRYGPASALSIEHVISHGRSGAVNGIVAFGEKRRAFCHVYEFSNARGARVSSLTSYSLPLK